VNPERKNCFSETLSSTILMANFVQVTPMLHVPNIGEARDFFGRVLGFAELFRQTNYSYFEREGVGVRVLEETERTAVRIEEARMMVYVDVRDVDALYNELKPTLAALPHEDVIEPTDQHWSQREFWVRMPDGHWLTFGQPVQS
jgi:catechol 2,3-dioxygenase-like lactoylglutathione lyase family enzyme